jgi:asparagine synthase (glutamine-hydrolysing)
MCGIAGIVDFDGRLVSPSIVGAMCEAIAHRGPNEQGVAVVGGAERREEVDRRASAVLGNRRLSIIDVAGGHQPIANEDGSIWTIQNGEIYNYLELREDLAARGHRFATRSDTEVIVHLYEEYGESFAERLDGMFALAIWDGRSETLILARDRFGKKPLLYADDGRRFRFASEMQALLADPELETTLDHDAIGDYLTFMAIPAPRTVYREVRKLPPASLLVRRRGNLRVRRYWELSYEPKVAVAADEAERQLLQLLTGAVERRLMSEVPLGAFLSGGIDSSAVVACMARTMTQPVKTFSIGFEETAFNELPFARLVAERYRTEHHEFTVRPDAVSVLPILARNFGEPFADSSAIPSYYLAKLTREHVTVALNGDGGDEAFAGYGWHLASRLSEVWRRIPQPIGHAARRLVDALASSNDRRSRRARLRRFLAGADLSRAERYRAWLGFFTPDAQRALLVAPPSTEGARELDAIFERFAPFDAVDAMLAADVALYLPTDLLVKMDIASMSNSLEARSPFLDKTLTEFVARLPSSYKLRGRTSKYLLKRSLKEWLPAEILHRRKRGFAVPIAGWLRTDLRDFARDHLLAPRFAARGLFRAEEVASILRQHQSGAADYSHHLWILLMFDLWAREIDDARRRERRPVAVQG